MIEKNRNRNMKHLLIACAVFTIFLAVFIIAPSSTLTYTSLYDVVLTNVTEGNSTGVRLSAPLLFMDFNDAPEWMFTNNTYNVSQPQYVKDNSIYNNFGNRGETNFSGYGIIGNGLEFDGINDYVNTTLTNATFNTSNNFTISFWINSRFIVVASNTSAILSRWDANNNKRNVGFMLESTYVPYFYVSINGSGGGNVIGATSTAKINDSSKWYHIVGTYNSTHIVIYVNGSAGTAVNITQVSNNNGDSLLIGQWVSAWKTYMNGSLDEIMIFNRSLSDAEITNLYGNQSIGNQSYLATDANLITYYKFDNVSIIPNGAYDSKGNNHGNLTNFANLATQSYWNSTAGYDGSGAYQFDGKDDSIALANQLIGTDAITVSAWIYPISYGGSEFGRIVDNGKFNFRLQGSSSNQLSSSSDGSTGTYSSSNSIALNTWQFVVVTRTQTGITNFYINGTLSGTGNQNAGTPTTGTYNLVVGNHPTTPRSFNGTIDQVQIWNRVLSANEVLALYNGTLNNSNYIGKYSRQGDFKSLVFYNSSSAYWNVTLSIADTYSTHSGIVNADNTINLSYPNLVSYWKLNTNTVDTMNRYNGTPTNVNNATGLSSKGMSFNGINSRIAMSAINLNNGSRTYSAWIYRKSATNGAIVIGDNNEGGAGNDVGCMLRFNSNALQLRCGNASKVSNVTQATETFALNTWYHVVGMYNASANTTAIYINGVLNKNDTITGVADNLGGNAFSIGSYVSGVHYVFNGTIDEAMLFNTSLSASEVLALYKSGLSQHASTNITLQTRTANSYNTSDSGLVGLWSLNENGNDETNRNNGSCSNIVTGKVGNALVGDGSNDYVVTSVNATQNGTLSGWFKSYLNPSVNGYMIIGTQDATGRAYLSIIGSGGNISGGIGNENWGIIVGNTTTVNTWNHGLITWNTTTVNLYLNGGLQLSRALNGTPASSTFNIITHNSAGSPSWYFNGSVDEVMFFNRSLSTAEVLALYSNQSAGVQSYLATDANLVSYWKFDENFTGNNIAYDSKSSNNGNYTNMQCPLRNSSGIVGDAMRFDGVDDFINITNILNVLSTNNTVSVWARPLSMSANGNVIGCQFEERYYIGYLSSTNQFFISRGNPATQINSPIVSLNTWHNIIMVSESSNVSLYLDGVFINKTNYTAGTTYSICNIGKLITNYFNGSIDEVRIYNRSLSADEINDLYQLGSGHLNWGNWSNESTVASSQIIQISSSDNFMQFKANLYTNDTAVSPYVLNHSVTAITDQAPQITIIYPLNLSYSTFITSLNYTVSDDFNLSACWFNNGTTNTSPDFTCSNITGLNAFNGSYIWTIYANDSLNQVGSSTVRIYVDATSPIVSLNTPQNITITNTSSINMTANLTDNLGIKNATLYIYNTSSIYNVSHITSFASGVVNATIGAVVNFTDNNYTWYYIVNDWSGNSNTSLNYTLTVDLTQSNITSLVYYPNTSLEIDPNANITFNVSVTDNLAGVDTVLLYYYNSSGWNNVQMSHVAGAVYQANLTLASVNMNYTIYAWANDSAMNSNRTANQTFESAWDCTWNLSTTAIGAVFGWNQKKELSIININNTGDSEFNNPSSCTLTFKIVHDRLVEDIYFDGENYRTNEGYYVTLNAETNKTVLIEADFLDNDYEEDVNFTFDEINRRSQTATLNVTTTLISTSGGPYLYQTVESVPTYRYLTNQTFLLNGSIQNGVADGINASNFAYNVSFNWTLPDDFLIATSTVVYYIASQDASGTVVLGESTIDLIYDNLTNSTKQYNIINVSFNGTNLPDMEPGFVNVTLTSIGFNPNGSLIDDVNGETYFSDTESIELICYGTSDNICVVACEDDDPDCCGNAVCNTWEDCSSCSADCGECEVDEVTDTPTSTGGGGGGGGTIDIKDKNPVTVVQREALFQTSETYEIVRGKDNSFTLGVENAFDYPFENVTVEVTGFFSKYLSVQPEGMFTILPNEELNFTITIDAPDYFTQGTYELQISIDGILDKSSKLNDVMFYKYTPIHETRTIKLYVQEISRQEVDNMISTLDEYIAEMKSAGFNLAKFEESYGRLSSLLENHDYASISELFAQLEQQKQTAFAADTMIKEIEVAIRKAENKGISASETQRLLILARSAMERGDFDLALKRANDAKVTLALETVGKFSVSMFVEKYWSAMLGFLVVLIVLGYFAVLSGMYFVFKQRMRYLHNEHSVLLGLMKEAQIECFEKDKMDMNEYKETMAQYESKLNKVTEKLIEYETKERHAFKLFESETKMLDIEKTRILSLMRKTQEQYMNEERIETRSYEQKMKAYQERLSEIEERLVNIEAIKNIKKTMGLFARIRHIFSFGHRKDAEKLSTTGFFRKAPVVKYVNAYDKNISVGLSKLRFNLRHFALSINNNAKQLFASKNIFANKQVLRYRQILWLKQHLSWNHLSSISSRQLHKLLEKFTASMHSMNAQMKKLDAYMLHKSKMIISKPKEMVLKIGRLISKIEIKPMKYIEHMKTSTAVKHNELHQHKTHKQHMLDELKKAYKLHG